MDSNYMDIDRTELINRYIRKYNYKSYLEIGVQYVENNFLLVECDNKVGVDPEPISFDHRILKVPSDDFFKTNTAKFDIIFIDGLHENEQVQRDIKNSLKCLNGGGTIIMHDCNPKSEGQQHVPRQQVSWTGDVWKAFVAYRGKSNLKMFVVNVETGCGIIQRGKQEPLIVKDPTYDEFVKNKVSWLNLIEPKDLQV